MDTERTTDRIKCMAVYLCRASSSINNHRFAVTTKGECIASLSTGIYALKQLGGERTRDRTLAKIGVALGIAAACLFAALVVYAVVTRPEA